MAYVEVKAKTVELAIEAAMRELGVDDRDQLEVKVLQEPERGFLGLGGRDAIVKVSELAGAGSGKKGRSKKGSGGGSQGDGSQRGGGQKGSKGNNQGGRQQKGGNGGSKGGGGPKGGGDRSKDSGKGSGGGNSGGGGGKGGGKQSSGGKQSNGSSKQKQKKKEDDRDPLGVKDQEPLVEDFLSGLVGSFGLDGRVETTIEDDVIVAKVIGDQTEALVGPRGSVMEAVHELTKTVLQRTAQDSARVRLDIAGYAERRKQALSIYAQGLIEQVIEDGGEIMLEPMSASDRKVIHDAVAENDRVESYSEGESPKRYVVIARVDGEENGGEETGDDSGDGGEEE